MNTQPENAAGGRVTRSIRKRLTSLDSNQSSSGPGTPVTKLATLPETGTASPRRSTRRNSVSTPNETPMKATRGASSRLQTPEPKTPSRRSRLAILPVTTEEASVAITAEKKHVFKDLLEHDEVIIEESPKKDKTPKQDLKSSLTKEKSKDNDETEEKNRIARQPANLTPKVLIHKVALDFSTTKTPFTQSSKHEGEGFQRVTRSQSKSPEEISKVNDKITPQNSRKVEKNEKPIAIDEIIYLSTDEEDNINDAYVIKGRTVKMSETAEPMEVDESFHLEMVNSDEDNAYIGEHLPVKTDISITKQSNEALVKSARTTVEGAPEAIVKSAEAKTPKSVKTPQKDNSPEPTKKSEETNAPEPGKNNEGTSGLNPVENLEPEPNKELEEREKLTVALNKITIPPDSSEKTQATTPTEKPEGTSNPDPNMEHADNNVKPNADLSKAAIAINEIQLEENIVPVTMSQLADEIVEPTVIIDDKGKSVTFNDGSTEDAPKVLYPKTPGRSKSRSFNRLDFVLEDTESNRSFESARSTEKDDEYQCKGFLKSEEQKITKQDVAKTPYKSKFELTSVQSSTPIVKSDEQLVTSTVNNGSTESTPNAESKTGKSPGKLNFAETSLSKLWNRHIKGTVTDKIDTIEAEKAEEPISETVKSVRKFQTAVVQSSSEADEEDEITNSKSEFVEDEAMECPDYESGDSMDSEERDEIECNEIIDNGESIGSDEHSEDYDSAEGDEEYERNSFVVTDDDVETTNLDDGDSDAGDKIEMNKPKRKRIIAHSSDEEEEDVADNGKDANVNPFVAENIEVKTYTNKSDYKDSVVYKVIQISKGLNDSTSDVNLKSTGNNNEYVKNSSPVENVRKSKNLRDSSSDDHPDELKTNRSIGDTKHVESLDLLYSHESKNTTILSSRMTHEWENIEDDNEAAVPGMTYDRNLICVTPDVDANLGMFSGSDEEFSTRQESTKEHEVRGFDNSRYKQYGSIATERENNNASIEDNSHDGSAPEPAGTNKLKKTSGQLSVSFSSHVREKESRTCAQHHSFTIGMKVATDARNKSKQLNISRLASGNANSDSYESDGNKNDENEQSADDEEQKMIHQKEASEVAAYGDEEPNTNSGNIQASELSRDTWHMQKLFNPLQKSKRQSLYNPSSAGNEDEKQDNVSSRRSRRRTVSQLNGNDFSPSQSLIDTINERECELQRLRGKRKLLSKSFCGATDSFTQDVEERHEHKKFKIVDTDTDKNEDDDDDRDDKDTDDFDTNAIEENNLRIQATATKVKEQPTGKEISNDYKKVKIIMERCEDILEAANRAKLAQKRINKKTKVGLTNQRKVPIKRQHAVEAIASENDTSPPELKKQLKRLEKRKVALKQAIKASAQLLVGIGVDKPHAPEKKKKQKQLKVEKPTTVVKLPPPATKRGKMLINVSNSITSSASSTQTSITQSSPNSSDQENQQQQRIVGRIKTTAGYFIEGVPTPKKKRRYIEEIQMPTGTMRVEAISPTLGLFREEPISPHYSAGQGKQRKGFNVSGGTSNSKRSVEQWRVAEVGSRYSKRSPATATEMAMKFKESALEGKRVPRENLLQRKERQCLQGKF